MKTKQVGDFFMKSNPKTSRRQQQPEQPEQPEHDFSNEQIGNNPKNNINGIKASKNMHNSDPQLPNLNAKNKNYLQNGNRNNHLDYNSGNFDDYSLNNGGGQYNNDFNFNDYNLNNFRNVTTIPGSYDQNNHYHPPTTINSNKNSKI